MSVPNQQIGWSQESILLQRILKQLVYINQIAGKKTAAATAANTTSANTTT